MQEELNLMEPKDILNQELSYIQDGVNNSSHDFHSFILSTIRDNKPESRTVVLRGLNKSVPYLAFHTDLRSPKLGDLKNNNAVSALFYDRARKVQIRVNGNCHIEDDERTKAIWDSMHIHSKICYMSPKAPSSIIEDQTLNKIEKPDSEIDQADLDLGFERFCRVKVFIEKLDWLSLKHDGHRRLQFNFGDNTKIDWVAA
tara:strand:+ start:169 stop:768 length:600 start_codon:yes stop_codon:yes gene_type:complete